MSHTMAQQCYHQVPAPYQSAHPQMQQLYVADMTFSRQEQVNTTIRDHLQVTLMPHQEEALAWLSWREEQHTCGGILADEAGLGKILTMISLVLLKKLEAEVARKAQKGTYGSLQQTLIRQPPLQLTSHPMAPQHFQPAPAMYPDYQYAEKTFLRSSCTLVICPASLINKWAKTVERCCKRGTLKIYQYCGRYRERRPEVLAMNDMVFTSYRQVWSDLKSIKDVNGVEVVKVDEPALLHVFWDRIILDEAYNIKNPKSQTAILICRLLARARWAVTSYPIQNNPLDMFSLLRFLRFTTLDKYMMERLVKTAGSEELYTLVKSLILRRTKDQVTSTGNPFVSLLEKKKTIHSISLSSDERKIYDQLFQQSRSTSNKTNILVILLRLRQCCDHLSLLKELPDQESCETDGIELDLVSQMKEMGLVESDLGSGEVKPNMIFYPPSFLSTKIKFVIDRLMEIRVAGPMKSVIVSQWTEMLDVVASHLGWAGFRYWIIHRDIPLKKRDEAMEDFNINPLGPEVMLVSLKAGRVGLNLIGGNNLFFLDMHWNPALEDIVCDSIYRAGQMRSVHIHKIVCVDTIEEKILQLQTEKRRLINDVLTGSKEVPSQADLEFMIGDPYEHEA